MAVVTDIYLGRNWDGYPVAVFCRAGNVQTLFPTDQSLIRAAIRLERLRQKGTVKCLPDTNGLRYIRAEG